MQKDKTVNELTDFILEGQIELRKKNDELARRSEIFRGLIEVRDQLNSEIEKAKKQLKEMLPDGKIEKTIGNDTLTVTTSTAKSVVVNNLSLVPEEYLDEEEQQDIFERDGKFYKVVCNTGKIQEEIKVGKSCPEGCEIKKTRRISMKFNGKVI